MAQVNSVAVQLRLVHGGLNCLVFSVCYLLAGSMAQRQAISRSIALPFEIHIPFLPWLVLPYLSSWLFFCLAFFAVRSPDALRVLSHRLLLATVLGCLVFVLYPVYFGGPRPAVQPGVSAVFFDLLGLLDRPYNQCPSLHVAFCLLLWPSLRDAMAPSWHRPLLATWLGLTAASTLFTYQHHLLDVVGGALLGWACLRWIRPGRTEPQVAFYYAIAGGVAAIVGIATEHAVLGLYLAGSLCLVSLAYARGDRQFLHKHNGRHPWWICCLYAPYLLGYRLSWRAVVWRERRQPPCKQIGPQLWIGRRLSPAEAAQLPPDCSVIDLANELAETRSLRSHRYQYVPLLDIVAPPAAVVQDIVAAIRCETAAGHTVYLHCAMGYRRCVQIANAYLASV
ncbi:phosphatase PAP2 family protein [Rhodoferax sp.]|uniref:phosphatase PAP2 family protein n=1 Tax=Rhodoferax sp. TaxID=50421 RepID=UPI00374D1890